MQGLAVVPLFAGFDMRRDAGRLFQYDVTGGRYEESNFAATGSGSLHAGTVIKMGFRESQLREATIDLVINALFQAADEDSATGGPDPIRGIYPTVATITGAGFDPVAQTEISDQFAALLESMTVQTGGAEGGGAPSGGALHGGDAR